MSYIFIAHVEEDAEVALKIALGMEGAGYKTWCYEVDSIPGPSYIVRTGESVAQSQAVVVVISPHSLGSSQVTKEIVRAHESDKKFIPILRDITHTEFQQRQPEWREAIGSATSIRIPQDGIEAVIPLIIEGIRLMGIQPSVKADSERIGRIHKALDEIRNPPVSREIKIAKTAKPIKEAKKSKKPLLITLALAIVVAIIILVISLPRGGNDKGLDGGFTSNVTSSTPSESSTTTPLVMPLTTSPETDNPTQTPTTTLTPVLMPDLVIQDISWSPKNPNMEDAVSFTITLANIGKNKAASSRVAYYIDGVFQDTISVSSMDSGATGKVSFQWKAELENHTIKAVADFNDSVAESDETNNAKEISFSNTVVPDLIIQDITYTPTADNFWVPITVTIKNQGTGVARNFYVELYIDGYDYDRYYIDSLYPGQTAIAIFTPYTPGHVIKAVADSRNSVAESDETNNSKTVTYSASK